MNPSPPGSTRSRLAWALVAIPLGLQALIVHLLGVNTLVWDEFYYVDFIRQVRAGENWLPWLWLQHNEHRVIPMKLAMAPLALLTHWNTKTEMYLSVVLAGLVVLGLWRLYRLAGGESLLLFAPVPWLVCSLAQFQNMLFGMMICHYFTLLGVVWALVFLARGTAPGLAAAVLCGLTASYSIANGLLIWPVGLLLLVVLGARRTLTVAWAGASLAATLLYFYHFQIPPGTAPISHDLQGLYRFASFALASLGAPLGAGSMDWSRAAGLAVAVAIAFIAWRWRRQGRPLVRREALPGALILFALLSCGMIAVGRAASGIPPLESRYIAYSSLALIGVYLIVGLWSRQEWPAGRLWLAGATSLLIPGLLAADLFGLRQAKQWHSQRQREEFLLQTAESQPDEALTGLYFVPQLRKAVPYLRAERLGPFNAPQDLLLLVRWREGQVAGEILPGHPLEQTFVCNVETLRDAEGVLSTYGRQNRSTVMISLWEGGRRLGARTVPLSGVADSTWIAIEPAAPLHGCQGRRLTMRFESPDATPGNAASVWTYPRYYDGELRQDGALVLPGRALGLELNAQGAGLLN